MPVITGGVIHPVVRMALEGALRLRGPVADCSLVDAVGARGRDCLACGTSFRAVHIAFRRTPVRCSAVCIPALIAVEDCGFIPFAAADTHAGDDGQALECCAATECIQLATRITEGLARDVCNPVVVPVPVAALHAMMMLILSENLQRAAKRSRAITLTTVPQLPTCLLNTSIRPCGCAERRIDCEPVHVECPPATPHWAAEAVDTEQTSASTGGGGGGPVAILFTVTSSDGASSAIASPGVHPGLAPFPVALRVTKPVSSGFFPSANQHIIAVRGEPERANASSRGRTDAGVRAPAGPALLTALPDVLAVGSAVAVVDRDANSQHVFRTQRWAKD